MMLWRNGRRFREIISRGRCMSLVNDPVIEKHSSPTTTSARSTICVLLTQQRRRSQPRNEC